MSGQRLWGGATKVLIHDLDDARGYPKFSTPPNPLPNPWFLVDFQKNREKICGTFRGEQHGPVTVQMLR